ncbi:hypothetical protein BD324DRAFT_614413 [Kockovaella imperatae]|uniref:FAD-binding domain-containing protein n=1 Tax=Kockovaella imperatae TaxID=4999 RepID=A0A1Y1UNJ7_9TREE|nr:hypothetical protein BD324DRAFT_614413 [Kockovaella imperatae]ORX39631.1 hypothetical protein BD324DRAFT_614413 [Kockovaella imperatae]
MAAGSTLPVLISGAGLASLLFAQSLRRSKIPFVIFERDKSVSFRGQGYRLRLSSEGLQAVKDVVGPEEYERFYEICGKTSGGGMQKYNAVTGERMDDDAEQRIAPGTAQTIGIARGDLRKFLMEGCEDDIQWGKTVKSYELVEDGVFAVFADGEKSTKGSLLVAGDGISSTIAKQVSDGRLKVFDTGARGIHGQAPTTAFKDIGEGVFSFTDKRADNHTMSCITNVRSGDKDDPTKEFGFTIIASPGLIKAPGDNYSLVGEPAARLAQDLTSNWNKRFKPIFDQINVDQAAFWKITCSTETGVPEWDNVPRVTVIGDAAHSVTPAGGLGANTAMQDSALLGKLLAQNGGYADGITAEYEKEMRKYASEVVKKSYGLANESLGVGPLKNEL